MPEDASDTAEAVVNSVGLLARRLRQVHVPGELTLAERAAMARLYRIGAATAAELARAEQISPQSMGVTLTALERRQLIERGRDPQDGRRVVFSFTGPGLDWWKSSRNTRADVAAQILTDKFTEPEIEQLAAAAQLLERLALAIPPS